MFGSGLFPLVYRWWSALLELSIHTGPWGLEVPMQGTGCVDLVSAMSRVQPCCCELKAEWKQSQGKEKGPDGHKGLGVSVQKHVPNRLLHLQGRAASTPPPCPWCEGPVVSPADSAVLHVECVTIIPTLVKTSDCSRHYCHTQLLLTGLNKLTEGNILLR